MTNQQTGATAKKEIVQRVAVYVRISTTKQANEGFGLEIQKQLLSSFIESNKDMWWETSEELTYIDEGVDGKTDVSERPGLSKMKEDILNSKIDIVLVLSMDRLFRRTLFLFDFVKFLKEQNINFVTRDEMVDLNSYTGKLFMNILKTMTDKMSIDMYDDELISKNENIDLNSFSWKFISLILRKIREMELGSEK